MPKIFDKILPSSAQASSSRQAKAPQKIGNHELPALKTRLKNTLTERFTEVWDQRKHVGSIGGKNMAMLAVLQAVSDVLSEKGIQLPVHGRLPKGTEQLLDFALEDVRNDPAKYRRCGTMPSQAPLHQEAIEKLHRTIDTSKTPLASIPAEHRWRLCLDPAFVDLVETHISGARDNKLLPFMMDSEPGYLHGVLKGWSKSMQSLKSPLDAKLLTDLHQAVCNERPFSKSEKIRCGFGLTMGENMTAEGRDELLAFGRELNARLPEYAVTESKEHFEQYEALLSAATMQGLPVPMPPAPTGNVASVAHSDVRFDRLSEEMTRFLNDYEKKMPDCKTDDERLENIVDVCQKLERLHPFPDGNARSFAILTLNHLLARNGMPLTMLSDPNILDGWSRAQVVEEVKVGQQRVAAYATSQGEAGQATSSKHWHDSMRDRFNKMF